MCIWQPVDINTVVMSWKLNQCETMGRPCPATVATVARNLPTLISVCGHNSTTTRRPNVAQTHYTFITDTVLAKRNHSKPLFRGMFVPLATMKCTAMVQNPSKIWSDVSTALRTCPYTRTDNSDIVPRTTRLARALVKHTFNGCTSRMFLSPHISCKTEEPLVKHEQGMHTRTCSSANVRNNQDGCSL